MALLKKDGSLDIESINSLPLEEFMDEMGSLSDEQVEEYLAALPDDRPKEMKRRIDNFILEDLTPTPVEQALYDGTFDELVAKSDSLDEEEIHQDFLQVEDFDVAMQQIIDEIDFL